MDGMRQRRIPAPLTRTLVIRLTMRVSTRSWTQQDGWDQPLPASAATSADRLLVLACCDPRADSRPAIDDLLASYPGAAVLACSTAGSICGGQVSDVAASVSIVEFRTATVTAAMVRLSDPRESRATGQRLARILLGSENERPAAVLVISDGLIVNGSDLVTGMAEVLPDEVPISGGLAGDGPDFERTWVSLGSERVNYGVLGIALRGQGLRVGHGSEGGWQGFGPHRRITASQGSTLLELDGKPALDIYRDYLGEFAAELPSSALLFPLRIISPDGDVSLVRTVLSVDAEQHSMRFAGDVPQGWRAQLMRTSFDRLLDGAGRAAQESVRQVPSPTWALAVSCVGRRLVLGDRSDEEAEICLDVLGEGVTLHGFYSYGEIAPVDGYSGLHNQTMTLTTLSEGPA